MIADDFIIIIILTGLKLQGEKRSFTLSVNALEALMHLYNVYEEALVCIKMRDDEHFVDKQREGVALFADAVLKRRDKDITTQTQSESRYIIYVKREYIRVGDCLAGLKISTLKGGR